VLYEAFDFIGAALAAGGRVLVHCSQVRSAGAVGRRPAAPAAAAIAAATATPKLQLLLAAPRTVRPASPAHRRGARRPPPSPATPAHPQGVSRSASLVIAYLMWSLRKGFDETFGLVKAARGVASPNIGFTCQVGRGGCYCWRGGALGAGRVCAVAAAAAAAELEYSDADWIDCWC
jgi:hypothetical protein